MKKNTFGVFWLAIFLFSVFSCGNTNQEQSSREKIKRVPAAQFNVGISQEIVETIDAKTFAEKLKTEKPQLIDVRTPSEYAEGHLPHSVLINFYDTDFKEKITALDKSKTVFVYCAVGGRSAKAAEIMKQAGFQKIYNMEGGFNAWKSAGLTFEK